MESIVIERTDDKPRIILDKKRNLFLFEGVSMCEDVTTFYKPVIDWLNNYYLHNPNPNTIVKFKLMYFNTASSKMILNVLLCFDELCKKGHDVHVEWYYQPDDNDMEDAGKFYSSRLSIAWKMIKDDTMDL